MSVPTSSRLDSLDILRGVDLFLLLFLQPIIISLAQQADLPWLHAISYQFDHEIWEGFRLWDIIMPLFLFMAGAAMPFAFVKYRQQTDKGAIYRHILRRVFLLFLLGAIVQGNLLALDIHRIFLYSNTLQAIAIGYLIAAVLQLHLGIRGQLAATLALLILYWIPMTLCGDFTPQGNWADWVDRCILGRFRDGASLAPDGSVLFDASYTYTWIWSSLTFGVTVMMGSFAGRIMKQGKDKGHNTLLLTLIGVGCIAAALLWSLQMPIIKRIWTSSMTLFSGGICYLLMALSYYLIDYKGHKRGTAWLKFYGMNSIFAYVVGEVINFRSVVHSLTYGLESVVGNLYPTLLTLGNVLILFFILRALFRRQIFFKV